MPAPTPQRPQAGAPTKLPTAARPRPSAPAAASPVPLSLDLLQQHLPPAPSHPPPQAPAPRVPSWSEPPPLPPFSSAAPAPHPVPLPLPRKAASVSSPSQPWPSAALPAPAGGQHAALPAPSRPQPRRPQPVLGAFEGGALQEPQHRWPQDVGALPQWLPQPTFQPQVLFFWLSCARSSSCRGLAGSPLLWCTPLVLLPCSCSAEAVWRVPLPWVLIGPYDTCHSVASVKNLLVQHAGRDCVSCRPHFQACS